MTRSTAFVASSTDIGLNPCSMARRTINGVFAIGNDYLHTAVSQVQPVGVAHSESKADHGHGLALQGVQRGVSSRRSF